MGNGGFALGFALQSVLAQLEYYRMVMQKGTRAQQLMASVTPKPNAS